MEFKSKLDLDSDDWKVYAEAIERAQKWEDIPLTRDGVVIGTATLDRDGTVTARIVDEKAEELGILPETTGFSIRTNPSLRELWELRETQL